MELIFLGRGSAFNSKEGNTAAYFIENDELFLIDCGSSIFESIDSEKLLEKVKRVNIMITHTHGDHVGSLSTLIERCFYRLGEKIPVNIILPNDKSYYKRIKMFLSILGVRKSMYKCLCDYEYDNKYNTFQNIRYIKTTHLRYKNFPSFGLLFNTNNGLVYYSGDTNDVKLLQEIISQGNIDKIYIDTASIDYPGNVHMFIEKLKKLIPEDLMSQVYCMHLDNDNCILLAKKAGFNVVENIGKRRIYSK